MNLGNYRESKNFVDQTNLINKIMYLWQNQQFMDKLRRSPDNSISVIGWDEYGNPVPNPMLPQRKQPKGGIP